MSVEPTRQPRKRRGKCALIEPAQVRAMAAAGRTLNEMATEFDVSPVAIKGICSDYGIPLNAKPGRRPSNPRPAQSQAHAIPERPKGRDAEIRATGGRYADLRAWAQRWGVTEVKARQEWHALRLPVAKGGTV